MLFAFQDVTIDPIWVHCIKFSNFLQTNFKLSTLFLLFAAQTDFNPQPIATHQQNHPLVFITWYNIKNCFLNHPQHHALHPYQALPLNSLLVNSCCICVKPKWSSIIATVAIDIVIKASHYCQTTCSVVESARIVRVFPAYSWLCYIFAFSNHFFVLLGTLPV